MNEDETLYQSDDNFNLSLAQMKLLDILGHYPETTDVNIAKSVGYRYYNYVSTVKNKILKPRGYLSGPNYWININKISNNKVNRLIFIILFNKQYDYQKMIDILKNIECWSYFYPLEESNFNQLMACIYSTDNKQLIDIFDYLLKENIIFYYNVYELKEQYKVFNPYYIKNDKKELLTPLTTKKLYISDKIDDELSNFYQIDENNKKNNILSLLDTRIIMHLQSSNLNCELSKLMKKDANIINEKGDRPYLFGYNSWRYSYEKLKTKNIMKKYYTIYPLPKNKCSHFFIFLKGTNDANTKILASSVGKESRVLRAGSYVKSLNKDDYGDYYWCVHVRSHPLYKEKILDLLELPIVENKIRYNIRAINPDMLPYAKYYNHQSISLEEKYYNTETALINYNYKEYKRNIVNFLNRN